MYLTYFQFKKEPFNITPDPEFLFLSPAHKEALASIIYGVEQRKGFIAVSGEIGVGKTTILRSYLAETDPEKLLAIFIFNPMLSFQNLLRIIGRELGIAQNSSSSTFEMLNQIHEQLVLEFKKGRNIALIIDEAQNMPVDTLENLRMLSNIETSKEKLIQIVFSAQPEFEKTLNLQELKQLKQRVSVKAVISPLDQDTGIRYIQSRIQKAGILDSAPFTPGAMKEIIRLSEGIPRVINILCDNCLISAYGYGQKKVNTSIVREVARDNGIKGSAIYRMQIPLLATMAFVVLASVSVILVKAFSPSVQTQPPPPAVIAPKQSAKPVKAVESGYVERVARKGDTLAKLVLEVYGQVDSTKIALVKSVNPRIRNENLIAEGLRIRFPLRRSD